MIYAYYSGSRTDYHDALVPVHSFVYTRALFFLFGTVGPTTDFMKNVNSKYVYMLAVFGGAVIAIGHCHRPMAVPVYLMMVHIVGKVNFWTRRKVESYKCATILP